MYKALSGQALSYDMELIVPYFPTRTLWSQDAELLVVGLEVELSVYKLLIFVLPHCLQVLLSLEL